MRGFSCACVLSSPASAVQAARGLRALSPYAARLFPPRQVSRAASGLGALSPVGHAFSLRDPRARRRSGLRKSLDGNRGLFAGWGRVASLGLSLPLAPPPASFLQRGWGGSSLEFLSPFVLRTAGGVFQPVNFSALPQFKKKKPPSDCSQGLLAGPHPKQCRRLLFVPPPLAVGGCGRQGYFSAGSCFLARNLWALFNFSSQLGFPPRFENFPQTHQRECFLVIGNFLY